MGLLLQEPQDVRRIGFGEELRKELLSAGVVTIQHFNEQAVVPEESVGFEKPREIGVLVLDVVGQFCSEW